MKRRHISTRVRRIRGAWYGDGWVVDYMPPLAPWTTISQLFASEDDAKACEPAYRDALAGADDAIEAIRVKAMALDAAR